MSNTNTGTPDSTFTNIVQSIGSNLNPSTWLGNIGQTIGQGTKVVKVVGNILSMSAIDIALIIISILIIFGVLINSNKGTIAKASLA